MGLSRMQRWSLVGLLGGGTLLFMVWPGLDPALTALFYDPDRGGFYLERSTWALFFYHLARYLTILSLLIPLLWLLASVLPRWRGRVGNRWGAIYLLLVLVLGPGLAVNSLLKEYWGRARPEQVETFGGTKIYTPAWQVSDQCERNCSFASGHASIGFYWLAYAFVFPRRRALWLGVGLGLGSAESLTRVVQGGHFASDVLMAGLIVWLTAEGVFRLLRRRLPAAAVSDAKHARE